MEAPAGTQLEAAFGVFQVSYGFLSIHLFLTHKPVIIVMWGILGPGKVGNLGTGGIAGTGGLKVFDCLSYRLMHP